VAGLPQAPVRGHRLGLDNFAVRAMGWKAPQLVDYAASLGCSTLFITDLDAFESLDDGYMAAVRREGDVEVPARAARHVERVPHLEGLQAESRHGRTSISRSPSARPKRSAHP
jgi:hypothetical protein